MYARRQGSFPNTRYVCIIFLIQRGARPDSNNTSNNTPTPAGRGAGNIIMLEGGGAENSASSSLRRVPSVGGGSSSFAAGRLYEASRLDKEVALAELEATRLKRAVSYTHLTLPTKRIV
eukprot:TRINITY_DN39927_c0_g1_i1.p1 TRINITY_DN39927_c0_g1~~TRINITY_DN39927_c0_g1_i1.p1  ORF type:complete len:119 (+),score=19.24 TRINITY_DN39927_c0_g1_i1:56-412(+)